MIYYRIKSIVFFPARHRSCVWEYEGDFASDVIEVTQLC